MTSPISPEAAAVWLKTSDEILAGLTHALNNRLAAVGSIARVLDYGDSGDLHQALIDEIEHLEATIGLLHWIPRTDQDSIELIHLHDFVEPLLLLHRLRRDTRDVELVLSSEEVVAPGFAEPVLLARAVLIALETACRAAKQNEISEVNVRCGGANSAYLLIGSEDLGAGYETRKWVAELRAAGALALSAGVGSNTSDCIEELGFPLRFDLPVDPPGVIAGDN